MNEYVDTKCENMQYITYVMIEFFMSCQEWDNRN